MERSPQKPRNTESLLGKLPLFYKIACERPDSDPDSFPNSWTDDEKEAWEAHEARLWIDKVGPLYTEDADWSLTVEVFGEGEKGLGRTEP